MGRDGRAGPRGRGLLSGGRRGLSASSPDARLPRGGAGRPCRARRHFADAGRRSAGGALRSPAAGFRVAGGERRVGGSQPGRRRAGPAGRGADREPDRRRHQEVHRTSLKQRRGIEEASVQVPNRARERGVMRAGLVLGLIVAAGLPVWPVAGQQAPRAVETVPGMPPVVDATNLYSETRPDKLSPAVAQARPRVYVPNLKSNDVYVIDPATLKVVDRFRVGINPQHIVPSYDLKTLWVTNNAEGRTDGSLTPIDPATGKPGKAIAVDDPYNMYFSTDGRFAIFTCEFQGSLAKIDLVARKVMGYLRLSKGGMPQDIRISPDG